MKSKKYPKNNNVILSNALSALLSRLSYSASLGMSYGDNNNDRDLYQALGYRKTLLFENYYNYYKRDPVGRALINKLPEAVWKSNPTISETDETKKDSKLEQDYRELEKRLKINNKMLRLDKLRGLGRYGVLLYGFNDVLTIKDFEKPIMPSASLDIKYIHPYSENSALIHKFDTNPNSERYSLPEIYQITVGVSTDYGQDQNSTSSSQTILVHYSRVLHVAKNTLESDVYGSPELEEIYNNILNIEKIAGGSAEMFWRGARPGYVAKAEKDATLGNLDQNALQEQFDEMDHNLRRWLTVQGVDVKALETQVANPKDHVETQMQLVSIAKGIPKRILMGSERGELASSQDVNTWNELIFQAMTNYAEPVMLRPFIDMLIEYKLISAPASGEDEYMINWPELSAIGEKEKAEINKLKAETLAIYTNAIGADMLYPPEVFLEKMMEMNAEEILEVQEQLKEFPVREEPEPKEVIEE